MNRTFKQSNHIPSLSVIQDNDRALFSVNIKINKNKNKLILFFIKKMFEKQRNRNGERKGETERYSLSWFTSQMQ